jgi:hypothetical protein
LVLGFGESASRVGTAAAAGSHVLPLCHPERSQGSEFPLTEYNAVLTLANDQK